MSGWAHRWRLDDGRCSEDVEGMRCGCYPPTPDPDSPCGFREGGPLDIPCGATGSDDWHKRSFWWQEPWLHHSHVPTRCTCGHPIEPTPGGTR